ncbi:glycosyltransferase [Catellatospora sp. KI3]|uniref:glycosyltransferase family 2 protein n=1 Tax=Catellatospora sp. KI3 TaxID=3041620 RepID=UPI002482A0C8|nr:glycosyltransferase [Catellatospora sp. KI3]MDI1460066.1 glycosyltransferase [Catellatospora sp. KI3]
MTAIPDVTVITAVYDTMPYLTRCLSSLAQQTIGPDRMEVVAVDDGSTDGSGRELDRWARRHPGVFHVVHQPNSGGPAMPSNRALELATGRYVFFLGADDHLGREALARLVAAADTYGSDIVLGRLTGVNGRYVHQAVFARNAVEIGMFDSALPWALSNTKLFRRDLITKHGLRYPEDMPVFSDQPFTLEACLLARRISVVADYPCYHAVRRADAGNITYRSRHDERARCTERIMELTERLVPAGPDRDAINVRHFAWELSKLLEPDFLRQEPTVRTRVAATVGRLARAHLTDGVEARLPAGAVLRFRLAAADRHDELEAVIAHDATGAAPDVHISAGRVYAGHATLAAGRPDPLYDLTSHAAELVAERITVRAATLRHGPSGPELHLTAECPAPGPDPDTPVHLCVDTTHARATITSTRTRTPPSPAPGAGAGAGADHAVSGKVRESWAADVQFPRNCMIQSAERPAERPTERPAERQAECAVDAAGVVLRVRVPLAGVLGGFGPDGGQLPVRVMLAALGGHCDVPLRAGRGLRLPQLVHRRGIRPVRVALAVSHTGRLLLTAAPVTVGRILDRLRRRLRVPGPAEARQRKDHP